MKTYIVDIDNTICRTEGSDYPNSEPLLERIEAINGLYEDGHRIIYWTARGRSSGIDWSSETLQQLQRWGCKFHELRTDKPSYDVWIDDKAIHSDAFFRITE